MFLELLESHIHLQPVYHSQFAHVSALLLALSPDLFFSPPLLCRFNLLTAHQLLIVFPIFPLHARSYSGLTFT